MRAWKLEVRRRADAMLAELRKSENSSLVLEGAYLKPEDRRRAFRFEYGAVEPVWLKVLIAIHAGHVLGEQKVEHYLKILDRYDAYMFERVNATRFQKVELIGDLEEWLKTTVSTSNGWHSLLTPSGQASSGQVTQSKLS